MFVIRRTRSFNLIVEDKEHRGYVRVKNGKVEICTNIKDADIYNTKEQAERERILYIAGGRIKERNFEIEVLKLKKRNKKIRHKNGTMISKACIEVYSMDGSLRNRMWFRANRSKEKEEDYYYDGTLEEVIYYMEYQIEEYIEYETKEISESYNYKGKLWSKTHWRDNENAERTEYYRESGTLEAIEYYKKDRTRGVFDTKVSYDKSGKKIKTEYYDGFRWVLKEQHE